MRFMNGVDKVKGIIHPSIDMDTARLSFSLIIEDNYGKRTIQEQRVLHLSPSFFTDNKGGRISPKELREKCVDLSLEYRITIKRLSISYKIFNTRDCL